MQINYKDDRTWKYIETHLRTQIQKWQEKIADKSTTWDDVSYYRGMIGCAKEILKLPDIDQQLATTRGKS